MRLEDKKLTLHEGEAMNWAANSKKVSAQSLNL